jgi:transposase-like protein
MVKVKRSELPQDVVEVSTGYERSWYKCKKCGKLQYHDYIPYSLSNPVLSLVCNCGLFKELAEAVEVVEDYELTEQWPTWEDLDAALMHAKVLLKVKDDTIKALEKTVEELTEKVAPSEGIETVAIEKHDGFIDKFEAINLQTGERMMFGWKEQAIRHYNSYGFRVCGATVRTVYMTREVKHEQ